MTEDEQALDEIKRSLQRIKDEYQQLALPQLKTAHRYVGRASNFVWGKFEEGTPEEKDILRPIYQTIIDLTFSMQRRIAEVKETN